MFSNLVVGIDGSEMSVKALDAGLALAKSFGSKLTVVTATAPIDTGLGAGGFGTMSAEPIVERLEEAYEGDAKRVLDAAKAQAAEAGIAIDAVHVARQRPADAIIEQAAKFGADAIVMGSHGRRGIQRLLLGSQAAEVLARSSIPVLIIK